MSENKITKNVNCDQCKRKMFSVIDVGEDYYKYSRTARLCEDCLNKALTLIKYSKKMKYDIDEIIFIIKGCFDYQGGYHDDKELEIYHHGINTVLNTMKALKNNKNSTQLKKLRMLGKIK